jgi:2-oxoisovalerate dehydrogenase E1 component alpha subunit
MSYTEATVQVLSADGRFEPTENAAEYLPYVERLTDDQLRDFHRHMTVMRRVDTEASNLQRQGQLGIWIPSVGQEAAQVGSAFAARPTDHIFPAYREHAVARVRGVDVMRIIEMLRGLSHGGWNPADHNNFHLYTLVIGSQVLHATGYAMGLQLEGNVDEEAVVVYFGDGATSQGDVSEALVFAASYNTPQVFFLQNNHWAISVPVSRQSRTPLYQRAGGFGIPGIQVDGNDVLASYAVTAHCLDAARTGDGPRFIEALTYRIGAHTTSDDPTKYRDDAEMAFWVERDPIVRFESYLRGRGESDAFFASVHEEAEDLAADVRQKTYALGSPGQEKIFDHVYSEPHPLIAQQKAWLADYEEQYAGDAAASGGVA